MWIWFINYTSRDEYWFKYHFHFHFSQNYRLLNAIDWENWILFIWFIPILPLFVSDIQKLRFFWIMLQRKLPIYCVITVGYSILFHFIRIQFDWPLSFILRFFFLFKNVNRLTTSRVGGSKCNPVYSCTANTVESVLVVAGDDFSIILLFL